MALIDTVLNSNLVQMAATFACGAGFYVLVKRCRSVLSYVGYIITFGILFSFLFNIGEVYTYSDYYKRAFFIFGDGVTTVIVLFFCYAVLSDNKILSILTAVSIILSGGKISFVLLVIMIVALIFVTKKNGCHAASKFIKYFAVGILIYCAMIFVSSIMERSGVNSFVKSICSEIESIDLIGTGDGTISDKAPLKGAGACITLSHCFETQIQAAFFQRYYSSLAGLWMTMEGGFRGERYPASSIEFADLMIQENPWGMNEKYGLTWTDWKKMGAPQNPYLRFGSGYGPWYLSVIVVGFLSIGMVAFFNLLRGERGPSAVFSIFYIVNVVFNQTQPWLMSGSLILALLGFCAFSILITWLSRQYQLPESFRPFVDLRPGVVNV